MSGSERQRAAASGSERMVVVARGFGLGLGSGSDFGLVRVQGMTVVRPLYFCFFATAEADVESGRAPMALLHWGCPAGEEEWRVRNGLEARASDGQAHLSASEHRYARLGDLVTCSGKADLKANDACTCCLYLTL